MPSRHRLQSSLRDWKGCLHAHPALKRWATLSRPYGTEFKVDTPDAPLRTHQVLPEKAHHALLRLPRIHAHEIVIRLQPHHLAALARGLVDRLGADAGDELVFG